jgi:hypothetical protein
MNVPQARKYRSNVDQAVPPYSGHWIKGSTAPSFCHLGFIGLY